MVAEAAFGVVLLLVPPTVASPAGNRDWLVKNGSSGETEGRYSPHALGALPMIGWTEQVKAELAALGALPPNWSSYGAGPNTAAIALASTVVDHLGAFGVRPYQLVPMADGGVALRFKAELRVARIEVTNDGEIVLVTHGSPESEPDYRELSAQQAAREVATFLE